MSSTDLSFGSSSSSSLTAVHHNSSGAATVHHHHPPNPNRSRPGGPKRVQHISSGPTDVQTADDEQHPPAGDCDESTASLGSTLAAQLTFEEPTTTNDGDVSFTDDDASNGATDTTDQMPPAELGHETSDVDNHLEETVRLLDSSDQSIGDDVGGGGGGGGGGADNSDPFGRRVSRVRTLSGTPLSVPLNCSPAVLRHGLGTALSTNTGDVVGTSATARNAAQAVADGSTGKFEEIGKRKNIKWDPALLIEGVLFRANYLGSTQLACDGQPTKTSRMMQAEEAVARIKAPDGEHQPSTEVDLCISTLKIMVLNTGTSDVIMDPALRTISYIADIGDLVVLMARRPLSRLPPPPPGDTTTDLSPPQQPPPKILCHVFESREALLIAQTIGQAFQVAYSEFLSANGLTSVDEDAHADADRDATLDVDYQAVLSSQAIAGDELEVFSHKERQKEITVCKTAGEILGLVLVESGWGSLLPTVVVANMSSTGAAARGGEMCIGDQIIAVNGTSLVGLTLATAESVIGRVAKGKTSVQFTLVPCAPVVEVLIRRPSTKFQLGFSVQMGVVCSLLRGGIAERGGVRVGHRIIEINEQSVVAVTHERIVNMLATAVGEIRMKTMPTSMYRLLTGQDNPAYI